MELGGSYGFIEYYPFTKGLVVVILVMIILWFVASADSARLVVDMLTADGNTNSPKIQRLFWVTSEEVISAILIAAGGLSALQAAVIIARLPFAFVMMHCYLEDLEETN